METKPFAIGSRVELHPGLDRWMMGDRYGEVTGYTRDGKVRVLLDKSGKTLRLPTNRVTAI